MLIDGTLSLLISHLMEALTAVCTLARAALQPQAEGCQQIVLPNEIYVRENI